MKSLLVHFAKEHGDGRVEIAGRCSEDPIYLEDELGIEGSASRMRVLSIEVYGKQVDCLPTGYVGNLFLQRSAAFEPFVKMVGCPSKEK
jgi:hypothetical protein